MKYCSKCGNELFDDAVICPKCGCMADDAAKPAKKYCPNCGNRLFDEAVICPSCGCAVESIENIPFMKTSKQTNQKLFSMIGFITSILAIIFYFTPFVKTRFGLISYSGFHLLTHWHNKIGDIPCDTTVAFIIISILILMMPVYFAIRYYISSQRSKNMPYGMSKESNKIQRILSWIAMIIIALYPILFFGFFLLSEMGVDNIPIVSLGYGAILSGVFFAIGVILLQLGLEEY